METSVFSTILVNSSKLILPSRSKSASMMVLSTICQLISTILANSINTTYLLQLLVLQVAPHHHLQHNKQLAVTDVPVAINVVDTEGKPQLLFLVALAAKGGQSRDKLLEVDVATTVFVEDGDHACCERVGGDLGEGQEFIAFDGARVVLVATVSHKL